MLLGVELANVAVPPVIEKTKSLTSKDPLPFELLYTASLNVTATVLLSDAKLLPVIVGTVESYVQLNCVAALLLLPLASVNVPPATSMVVAPSKDGVNVAVYVVPLPLNELKLPPLTVTSPTTKLDVDSLLVKVILIVELLVVDPSEMRIIPLEAVITIVGPVLSFKVTVLLLWEVEATLPATS